MSFAKFTPGAFLVLVGVAAVLGACPAQAQNETVHYNFQSYPYGYTPSSGLTSDGKGNFYGTTPYGGEDGYGTVFELSPNGSGGWNETVLYTFPGNQLSGANSYSPVVFDSAGNLYGVTISGGTYRYGVVFELSPGSQGGTWTETVLHSFDGGLYGDSFPFSGLIFDRAGNLYGMDQIGVFELSPSGGNWTEQVIYNVNVGSGGLMMDALGNIFGAGSATVFELSPIGQGGWKPTVIDTFAPSPKGKNGLVGLVLDQTGNLYCTRTRNGTKGDGAVYMFSFGKNGLWKKKNLYSFQGGNDCTAPGEILLDTTGNIYGTTINGGVSNWGTVFKLLAPAGGGSYKHEVLWSFNEADGAYPFGNLSLDSVGNVYGTTTGGGSSNNGVAFEVSP
jgi:uncharacterized repeat protein (TIGR03803 family)